MFKHKQTKKAFCIVCSIPFTHMKHPSTHWNLKKAVLPLFGSSSPLLLQTKEQQTKKVRIATLREESLLSATFLCV